VSVTFIGALFLAPALAAGDDVSEAFDSSIAQHRAAVASQGRVDKLAEETRSLREKRRATEWRAMQLAGYASKLEADAVAEEKKRKDLDEQLKRIASTGTDLMPLMRRMVDELDAFIARDLPFLKDARASRVAELRKLLDDPQRGNPEKFRRVMEAYRTEVDYGHSLGAEDAQGQCEPAGAPVSLVRVGRVGYYCLSADGKRGAAWDNGAWKPLDDSDYLDSLRHARAMAKAEEQPQLLQLPVRAPGHAK
jgi:hypothetical protein